jgi:septum formation protein
MGLILASGSARRVELLSTLGLDFIVTPSARIDEAKVLAEENSAIERRLVRLARLKGEYATREAPDELVLSADTVVVYEGEILGKPRDVDDARGMLTCLAGRAHHVYTGVVLQRRKDDLLKTGAEITKVTFNLLDSETIDRYIAQAQPYDMAGSYGIQGIGALLVRRIEGDYTNVVGLPLGLTARLLTEAGMRVL